jgi:hypothetical protein
MASLITKRHLSRRTFLAGAGVSVALPLLDSMVAAQTPTTQTAAVAKRRFVGIFMPHGMAPGYWVPKTVGANPDLPTVLEPLESYRSQLVVLSGLHARSAEPPPGSTGADHWVASAFMSAQKPKKTAGADVENGTTIDQIIAQQIGQETLLPSLQLGIEDPGSSSSTCGEGYSCAYTNSISWQTPTRPLPMEINPQVVFERLFGDGSTAVERALRRQQDRSILDLISQSLASLKREIGATDRRRVDEYLEDVREIERRLQIAAKASTETPAAEVPFGVPEAFDDHIKLQFDLAALAFRADITRVVTLLGARDLTNKNYPASGTLTGFHGGSHHGENPQNIANYSKINRYHVQCLGYFIDKLAQAQDGQGTLLDQSVVLYGTNMGNSNQHEHYDVPHLILGGAAGQLKGNRHLAYPRKAVPTGNVLLSVLGLFGIHRDSFGDSTGHLEGLV